MTFSWDQAVPLHAYLQRTSTASKRTFQSLRRLPPAFRNSAATPSMCSQVFNYIPASPGTADAKPVFSRDRHGEHGRSRPAHGQSNPPANFKSWLFEPENVRALDAGTIDIPKSSAPSMAARSPPAARSFGNRTSYGLLTDAELAAAIATANEPIRHIEETSPPPMAFACASMMPVASDATNREPSAEFHFMGTDFRCQQTSSSRKRDLRSCISTFHMATLRAAAGCSRRWLR